MRTLLLTATLLAGSAAFAAAHATPVTFDLAPTGAMANTDIGGTESVTDSPPIGGPQTIIATGYKGANKLVDLYDKHLGPPTGDENGLGLVNDSLGENEVTLGSFIQLDLSGLHAPPLTSLTFSALIDSTTNGEKAAFYGTNTPGTLLAADATLLASATADGVLSVDFSGFRYVDFTETGTGAGDNVLLGEFIGAVAAVPEPTSLALLGVGMVGVGAIRRRRRA